MEEKRLRICLLFLTFFWIALSVSLFAGTKGKIAGYIINSETGQALFGVNIVILDEGLGTASDENGYYAILNVSPDTYVLKATMIGYENIRVENVVVGMDLTTNINLKMVPATISMGEIVVEARRPLVVKDISANQLNIKADKIEMIPVNDITEVIGLQAGVKGMQIRGGDPRQTVFIVDGFILNDERFNNPYTSISLNTVKEIKVQTDGFNAEYENCRSGVVNVITKEGSKTGYSGALSFSFHPPSQKYFGRSIYSEKSYYLRPYLDPEVCDLGTYSGSWDQYTRNQYPEFPGWVYISGTTLKDEDPTNDLTPEGAKRLFEWQHRRNGDIKKPDYIADFSVGGPVPMIGKRLGNLRFYASYQELNEMFIIPLSRENYFDNVGRMKLTSDIGPDIKLTMTGQYGEIRSASPYNWQTTPTGEVLRSDYSVASAVFPELVFVPAWFSPADIYRNRIGVKINHILSPQIYYEFQVQHNIDRYNTFQLTVRDTAQNRDIIPGEGEYYVDEAPFGYWGYGISSLGDEIVIGGWMNLGRDKSTINTTSIRFDYTNQLDDRNQFKTGFNIVMNQFDINSFTSSPSKDTWNREQTYKALPFRAGLYLQDKLEFEGLIANLGLRLDYTDANSSYYMLDIYDDLYKASQGDNIEEEAPASEAKAVWALSPRLGISHPITGNSKLFFNYGHYRTEPSSTYRFRIQRESNGLVTSIGNTNLEPEKTVAYTIGYSHNILNAFLLNIAGYYKNVTKEIGWIDYQNINNTVKYSRPDNNRYQDIRGFEITLDKHTGEWITGFINYTYMVNTYGYFGLLKLYEDPNRQREYLQQNPYQERPKPRPYLRANIDLHTPLEFGPSFIHLYPLGGWNMNFLISWEAGLYATYNPNFVLGSGVLNNVQWKDKTNVDLRLTKTIHAEKFQMKFFVDMQNVFNFKYMYDSGFSDAQDYESYMESLHLSWEKGVQHGEDRVGEYRNPGVNFIPMQQVESVNQVSAPNERTLYYDTGDDTYYQYCDDTDWFIRDKNWVQKEVIDKKAYIDMPNILSLAFLHPRYIRFGVRISF